MATTAYSMVLVELTYSEQKTAKIVNINELVFANIGWRCGKSFNEKTSKLQYLSCNF